MILRIDASSNTQKSVSKEVSNKLSHSMSRAGFGDVIDRILIDTKISFMNQKIIESIFSSEESRTVDQKKLLQISDQLIKELFDADYYVIAFPIYNFGVPAILKAWADFVARARITFKYTDSGPVGLLKNKKAYLVVSSGGIKIGDKNDFATSWMIYFLNFLGVKDVEIIDLGQINFNKEEKISSAYHQIDKICSSFNNKI